MDKIPEYSAINPVFIVADISTTMDWYKTKLGFWVDPFPDHEPYVFAIVFRDNIEIMLQRVVGYEKPDVYRTRSGGVWDAYIRSTNVKALYEAIKDEVTIVQPLRQQPYGAWEFEVKDPNGYVLVFSQMDE
jgi:uncharacterized glyoxalase superfamily protein PhnB